MNDIMVDLETMDNVASAAIVSIGAVHCNLVSGKIYSEFYRVVDLEGQQELGLTLNTDTLYWWMEQSDGARHALLTRNKLFLPQACASFSKWVMSLDNPIQSDEYMAPEKLRLWGNGASFDNAIIRHAFRKCNMEFPTKFWNDRDMRTIVGFYPYQLQQKFKTNNLRTGTHHNALDDAKHQVKYCSAILQDLGVKELY